jgi:hypothetical protein
MLYKGLKQEKMKELTVSDGWAPITDDLSQ